MAERPIPFGVASRPEIFGLSATGSAIFAGRRARAVGVSTRAILVVAHPAIRPGRRPASLDSAVRWVRIYMQHEEGPCR